MQLSENDAHVGHALLSLYLRCEAGCDGICVTFDQALIFLDGLHPDAHPRVPLLAIRLLLSQIDQIVGPKLDGSPGYRLWLSWTNDKLIGLNMSDVHLTTNERDRLEAVAKLSKASVYFPEGDTLTGMLFRWP